MVFGGRRLTMSNAKQISSEPLARTEDTNLTAMAARAGEAVALLKGLANESRLMILCILAEGELSVNQLNKRLALSQPALSQHLALLREQGLVETRRDGQAIFYRLAESPALAVVKVLHQQFCGPDT